MTTRPFSHGILAADILLGAGRHSLDSFLIITKQTHTSFVTPSFSHCNKDLRSGSPIETNSQTHLLVFEAFDATLTSW